MIKSKRIILKGIENSLILFYILFKDFVYDSSCSSKNNFLLFFFIVRMDEERTTEKIYVL